MLTNIILIITSILITGIVVHLITKKWYEVHYTIYVERAKAKAFTIEKESQLMLDLSKSKAQEELFNLKNNFNKEYELREKEITEREELHQLKIKQELQDIEKIKITNKTII